MAGIQCELTGRLLRDPKTGYTKKNVPWWSGWVSVGEVDENAQTVEVNVSAWLDISGLQAGDELHVRGKVFMREHEGKRILTVRASEIRPVKLKQPELPLKNKGVPFSDDISHL